MHKTLRQIIIQLKDVAKKKWMIYFVTALVNRIYYYEKYIASNEDVGIREYGKLFSIAPALYYEGLKYNENKDEVANAVIQILKTVTLYKYSKVYPKGIDLQTFVQCHKQQNESGFLVYNKWEDVVDTDDIHQLRIKDCYFYKMFQLYGIPKMTLAFCEADETYFSSFSNRINFNRAATDSDTIARGGEDCLFHFKKIDKTI